MLPRLSSPILEHKEDQASPAVRVLPPTSFSSQAAGDDS